MAYDYSDWLNMWIQNQHFLTMGWILPYFIIPIDGARAYRKKTQKNLVVMLFMGEPPKLNNLREDSPELSQSRYVDLEEFKTPVSMAEIWKI